MSEAGWGGVLQVMKPHVIFMGSAQAKARKVSRSHSPAIVMEKSCDFLLILSK